MTISALLLLGLALFFGPRLIRGALNLEGLIDDGEEDEKGEGD